MQVFVSVFGPKHHFTTNVLLCLCPYNLAVQQKILENPEQILQGIQSNELIVQPIQHYGFCFYKAPKV